MFISRPYTQLTADGGSRNLRLEHMEMGDEPGPDAPKLGRKGKSKAKAKTAVTEAAAKAAPVLAAGGPYGDQGSWLSGA